MTDIGQWRGDVLADVAAGGRVVTLFGRDLGDDVVVTAVVEDGAEWRVRRAVVDPATGWHAMTEALPALHCFERELHEQHGVRIAGHPWLKPVRSQGGQEMRAYPYYTVEGKDVHEVAVGPVHAGVIEPGSFRFMCHGEVVIHLEVQLGYQHRGVEALLLRTPRRHLPPLVETICGDSSVAYGWAHAKVMEALAGWSSDAPTALSRALLLELERIAMHLGGLSGMSADIGFLQGATTYGRLRTTAINTTMRLCGSRFGRSGVRPGGPAYSFDGERREAVRAAVDLLEGDLSAIDARFLADRTVRHRLMGVGVVSTERARELGLVGMAARMAGVAIDQRGGALVGRPIEVVTEETGDCLARARVRIREIRASLGWIRRLLDEGVTWTKARREIGPLAPGRLEVAAVEGWRGEVIHAVETDERGEIAHYKVQDPSLRNWLGLALAVRGDEISDFPICNKSFDLSYSGHDL